MILKKFLDLIFSDFEKRSIIREQDKMMVGKILTWISYCLIVSECHIGKGYDEDGSQLIRINGDVILGGISPMREQVYILASYFIVDPLKLTSGRKIMLCQYLHCVIKIHHKVRQKEIKPLSGSLANFRKLRYSSTFEA